MYHGGNQQLSNWTFDPLHKKKLMLGTRNLAKQTELVKS